MTVEQLRLFPLPRELDPGEPYRCLDCRKVDWRGTYGPRQLDAIELEDGSEHTVNLRDQWFCARCSRLRWDEYLRRQDLLPARRRRLKAFRIAAEHGHKGDRLFEVAEHWLREDRIPGE